MKSHHVMPDKEPLYPGVERLQEFRKVLEEDSTASNIRVEVTKHPMADASVSLSYWTGEGEDAWMCRRRWFDEKTQAWKDEHLPKPEKEVPGQMMVVDSRGTSPFKDLRRADQVHLAETDPDWAKGRTPTIRALIWAQKIQERLLDREISVMDARQQLGFPAEGQAPTLKWVEDPESQSRRYWVTDGKTSIWLGSVDRRMMMVDPDLTRLQDFYSEAIEKDSPQRSEIPDKQASTPTSSPSTPGTTSLSTPTSPAPSSSSTNKGSLDPETGRENSFVSLRGIAGFY